MDQTVNEPVNSQLDDCVAQVQEWKEKYVQVSADFENFKKREQKERASWTRAAQSALLLPLLSIVDDFDRAFGQATAPESADQLAGFELIGKSLQKLLEGQGVTLITQVTTFDPALHEAVMQVESADHASGDIVQVLQKGYLLKGEVLRPAIVSVAK